MPVSRRSLLKMGAALAAVPLLGQLPADAAGEKIFSTGSPELDRALAGGIRHGSVLAVLGPRGSGKTAFLLKLAQANGIMDAYPIGTGTSDMLSIMEREDGSHVGSLMLDAAEPATTAERAAMAQDPAARDAFLTRWLQRTAEVTHESGGLFAISVCTSAAAGPSGWLAHPDYVITLNGTTPVVSKAPVHL